jgi:hypothetical protein
MGFFPIAGGADNECGLLWTSVLRAVIAAPPVV